MLVLIALVLIALVFVFVFVGIVLGTICAVATAISTSSSFIPCYVPFRLGRLEQLINAELYNYMLQVQKSEFFFWSTREADVSDRRWYHYWQAILWPVSGLIEINKNRSIFPLCHCARCTQDLPFSWWCFAVCASLANLLQTSPILFTETHAGRSQASTVFFPWDGGGIKVPGSFTNKPAQRWGAETGGREDSEESKEKKAIWKQKRGATQTQAQRTAFH